MIVQYDCVMSIDQMIDSLQKVKKKGFNTFRSRVIPGDLVGDNLEDAEDILRLYFKE